MLAMAEPQTDTALAARLAARICHDAAGPLSALQAGVDLLSDAQDPQSRAEALAVMHAGLSGLTATLDFNRTVFGPSAAPLPAAHLRVLAEGRFADRRPSLDWRVSETSLPASAARVLLIFVQIAAEALAAGGVARAGAEPEGGRTRVEVAAGGTRPRLAPDTLAGLEGRPPGPTAAGAWAPAAFAFSLVAAAQGRLVVRQTPEEIAFEAVI
jgi:histidine phosphotransferase ChpT